MYEHWLLTEVTTLHHCLSLIDEKSIEIHQKVFELQLDTFLIDDPYSPTVSSLTVFSLTKLKYLYCK